MNVEIAERIKLIKDGKVPKGYKKEKDCIIPATWNYIFLSEIMDFKNGLNYGKDDIGKKIKILGVGDFKDKFLITIEDLSEIQSNYFNKEYLLKNGDLVFVRSNGNKELIGRVVFCENIQEDITYSGFTIRGRLRSDEQIANEFIDKYCAYYCSSSLVKKQYVKNGGGTNISNLNQQILSNVKIIKPSIKEQKKIIQLINIWDKSIALKEKLIFEKEKQKQVLCERLLTGEIRLSSFNDNWKNIKLNDILTVRNEKSKITEDLELYSLTIEDGVTSKSERYNREFLVKDNDKKYKIAHYNDIVYNPANLRYGAIAINKIEKKILLSPIYETLYIKDFNKYDIDFISYILTWKRQIKKFSTKAEGTLVERKSVKVNDFISFKIGIPINIKEQKAISKILLTADKEINLLKKELEALKNQKKGLMQLLLTGIVRVKYD